MQHSEIRVRRIILDTRSLLPGEPRVAETTYPMTAQRALALMLPHRAGPVRFLDGGGWMARVDDPAFGAVFMVARPIVDPAR